MRFVDPPCSYVALRSCYDPVLPLLLLSCCFGLQDLLLPGVNCTNLLPVLCCNIIEYLDLEMMVPLHLGSKSRNMEYFKYR